MAQQELVPLSENTPNNEHVTAAVIEDNKDNQTSIDEGTAAAKNIVDSKIDDEKCICSTLCVVRYFCGSWCILVLLTCMVLPMTQIVVGLDMNDALEYYTQEEIDQDCGEGNINRDLLKILANPYIVWGIIDLVVIVLLLILFSFYACLPKRNNNYMRPIMSSIAGFYIFSKVVITAVLGGIAIHLSIQINLFCIPDGNKEGSFFDNVYNHTLLWYIAVCGSFLGQIVLSVAVLSFVGLHLVMVKLFNY